PAFVRVGLPSSVRFLLAAAGDEHGRVAHVRPAELRAPRLGPQRVPVARGLGLPLEHEERPALAKPGRRRLLRVREDAVHELPGDRPVLEAADHLALANRLLELHQTLRYVPRSRRSNPASTRCGAARRGRHAYPAACSAGAPSIARDATIPGVIHGPLRSRLPDRVQIVEVGPRDGLQAEERTLPTGTKLAFIERLLDAGHTVIEATS